jgi:hypothetical protein
MLSILNSTRWVADVWLWGFRCPRWDQLGSFTTESSWCFFCLMTINETMFHAPGNKISSIKDTQLQTLKKTRKHVVSDSKFTLSGNWHPGKIYSTSTDRSGRCLNMFFFRESNTDLSSVWTPAPFGWSWLRGLSQSGILIIQGIYCLLYPPVLKHGVLDNVTSCKHFCWS